MILVMNDVYHMDSCSEYEGGLRDDGSSVADVRYHGIVRGRPHSSVVGVGEHWD